MGMIVHGSPSQARHMAKEPRPYGKPVTLPVGSAAHRSWTMSRIRNKDTRPEMTVRRLLHGLGYRYRLHRKDLPGKPDIVLGPIRKVIFIHGCFWHGHDNGVCKRARIPRSRVDYWEPKLRRNIERDHIHEQQLKEAGWEVLTVWECEIKEKEHFVDRLVAFLGPPHSVQLAVPGRDRSRPQVPKT